MLSTLAYSLLVLAAADNNVEWSGISHYDWQDRRPLCPINGQTFEVRFQSWRNDLTAARVYADDGTPVWVDAEVVDTRGPYDIWAAQVPATTQSSESYYIELTDGTDTDYLSVSGLSETTPTDGGYVLDFLTLEHAPIGATPTTSGTVFKVWAPNATSVAIRGDFNGWLEAGMTKVGDYWIKREGAAQPGSEYKYYLNGNLWRPDPRARSLNAGSNLNSVVVDPFAYDWVIDDFDTPDLEELVIYQLHLGTFSGLNDPAGTPSFPAGYADVAARMSYLEDLGVNAILLMPVTEFPFDESAGYNPITAWSPEWAYGSPEDLKLLVDTAHQHGIAVLVDIIWNHFSGTDNFLWTFDGTQIYFDDPAVTTPWGDQADFDRVEVRDYFVDSAMHYLEEFKIDGFRMDATDFMNIFPQEASGWGLMQRFNDQVNNRYANKLVIAEQLPDDSFVTRPTNLGGAGFDAQYYDNFTDRLREEILDAAFGDPEMWKIRDIINGSGAYLSGKWVVNYVELHDEVWPTSGGQRLVKTIDTTFPHDDYYARSRVKLAQGIVFSAPGTPALFMGSEWLEDQDFGTAIGQRIDWNHLNVYPGVHDYFRDLIRERASNGALRSDSFWNVHHLNEVGNVIGWQRTNFLGTDVIMLANFSGTTYNGYRIGVPVAGDWYERINSMSTAYGEGGPDNAPIVVAEGVPADGFGQSIVIEVPASSFLMFRAGSGSVDTPEVAAGSATGLQLSRISPNPGSGARSIAFTLPREAQVTVDVVDLAGRRVARVTDETRAAGAHSVTWDGRDSGGNRVAAGTYWVRVQGGGEIATRKLTVLQ